VTAPGLARVLLAAALAAASVPAAQAVLGAGASSVQADEWRVGGKRRALAAPRATYTLHEIAMADGSSIREYLTPSGIVFAVAWSTRLKPDLPALLGTHADGYAQAARDAARARGGLQRAVVLQREDLVVQTSSHLGNFVGRAYLRSLVPAGVAIDELR